MSSRSYPDRPVAGVGGIVLDAGRVLLIRRGREPLLGAWTVPGGAVELGETMQAAVAREIREETGLVVDVGPVVEALEHIRTDAAGAVQYHYVLIDFLCHPAGGKLVPSSDAADAVWVDIGDLERLGVPESTTRVIRKARALR